MAVDQSRGVARAGFALVEVASAALAVVVVLALLTVSAHKSRRLASISETFANLRCYGSGTQSYAADNSDRIWSYSWFANQAMPTQYADLRTAGDPLTAAANQAVDIIRRRSGRSTFPTSAGWLPHLLYSHLVLVDYLGSELPARWAVSPADQVRQCWANDPVAFESGACTPAPASRAGRWAYSSSYEMGPAWFSNDYAVGSVSAISQGSSHNIWSIPGTAVLGGRRLMEVAYPSRKAMVWDSVQRHFGAAQPYFMMTDARIPILFGDGSTQIRTTAAANRGVDPMSPRSVAPITVVYSPDTWEPPVPTGDFASNFGGYRFTRAGLGGIDFDGDEITVP